MASDEFLEAVESLDTVDQQLRLARLAGSRLADLAPREIRGLLRHAVDVCATNQLFEERQRLLEAVRDVHALFVRQVVPGPGAFVVDASTELQVRAIAVVAAVVECHTERVGVARLVAEVLKSATGIAQILQSRALIEGLERDFAQVARGTQVEGDELWPDGVPEELQPAEQLEHLLEVTLVVPEGMTDDEAVRHATELACTLDHLHRSLGGDGLVLREADAGQWVPAMHGASL